MRPTSLAAALVIALVVSGCGTKGPLYLPPKTSGAQAAPPAPPVVAPAQPANDANTATEPR